MKLLKVISILFLSLSLSSCFAKKEETINLALTHSSDSGPKLNIAKYLDGNLEGWGYFEDESGIVKKRFTVKIKGNWDGNKGIIKRNLSFHDGKKDSRTWLITLDNNNFTAVGHEVVGTAKGQQYKGLARMIYTVKMKFDGQKQDTKVKETIYNINGKSSISTLEFEVDDKYQGKMVLSLHKVADKKSKKAVSVKSLSKEIEEKVKDAE